MARARCRARRRADGAEHRRERGADAAPAPRARRRPRGRGVRAVASATHAPALRTPLPQLRRRRRVSGRAARAEPPLDRLGARSVPLPAGAAPPRQDRARPAAAMSDTVVFIPAWNEEENLPAVLDGLRERLPAADVLVVDDGSTDRTADVAREHGAEVLSLGSNQGLRVGIAAGYRWALEHGYAFCGRVD